MQNVGYGMLDVHNGSGMESRRDQKSSRVFDVARDTIAKSNCLSYLLLN